MDILGVVGAFLLSGLKFLFGLGATFCFDLGFILTVLINVGGGMTGVFVFALAYKQLARVWQRIFHSKEDENEVKKVKFSKSRRKLVNFRNRFGVMGIALLTPAILQVPIGTIIALKLSGNLKLVSLYMFISFMLHSIILSAVYYLLDFDLGNFIKQCTSSIL